MGADGRRRRSSLGRAGRGCGAGAGAGLGRLRRRRRRERDLGRRLRGFRRLAVGDALLELGFDQRQLGLQHAAARFLVGEGGLERRFRIGRGLRRRRRVRPLAGRQRQCRVGRQTAAQQPGAAQQQKQQWQRRQERARPGDGRARRRAEHRHGGRDRRLEHGAVRGGTGQRRLRQGGRQQPGGGFLLVAPADDDRPVADHEDEGVGRRAGGKLQGEADQAGVLARARRGQRIAQAADVGQAAPDLGQDRFPARGIEGRQRLHRARPAGVPVDRLAVLVQLRIGQKVGGAIAQAAAHDAAQLRR